MVKREEIDMAKQIGGEIDILDDKIQAIVELLIEKKIIKEREWKDKIAVKLMDIEEKKA